MEKTFRIVCLAAIVCVASQFTLSEGYSATGKDDTQIISGPFSARINNSFSGFAIDINVDRNDAFDGDFKANFNTVLRAVQDYIFKHRLYPIGDIKVTGIWNGEEIYRLSIPINRNVMGSGTETFSRTKTLKKISDIPATSNGYLALERLLQELPSRRARSLVTAIQLRAVEIYPQALADLTARMTGFAGAQDGRNSMRHILEPFQNAARRLNAEKRHELEGLPEKILLANFETPFAETINKVSIYTPDRWDHILQIENRFKTSADFVNERGTSAHQSQFRDAIRKRAGDLFLQDTYLAQFSAELEEIPATKDSLDHFLELTDSLQSEIPRFPSLNAYVEKTQDKMGEIILSHAESIIEAIEIAGKTIFDIPDLIVDANDEAAWFEKLNFEEIAAAVRLGAAARCIEIADTHYEIFEKEIVALTPDDASIKLLRKHLAFVGRLEEEVSNLSRYIILLKRRLAEIKFLKESETYSKWGLREPVAGLDLDIGGRSMVLAAFAKNLAKSGHSVKSIGLRAIYASDTGAILGLLGWGTSEKALGAITVAMKDGTEMELSMTDMRPHGRFLPSALRHGKTVELLDDAEWVSLAFELGGFVPTGEPDEYGVTDSDQFASDPNDPDRKTKEGVILEEVNPSVAVGASIAALESSPNEPRYKFQLGRSLLAAGDVEQARRFLISSSEDGYSAASALLGVMALEKAITPDSKFAPVFLIEAENYLKRAVAGGYSAAKEHLESAKKTLAMVSPPFNDADFDIKGWIQTIYRGDIDDFSRFYADSHNAVKMYLLVLRSHAAASNSLFRNSALSAEIFEYAPAVAKRMAETKSFDPSQLSKREFSEALEFAMRSGILGAMKFPGGTPADAQDSAEILMMYIGDDQAEIMRFFGNVLTYLKKYHKKTP
jgi:hypothetical protein